MVDVPVATPVTLPEASTVATPVVTELQVPPVAASVKDVTEPAHTVEVPAILPEFGMGLTVTIVVATAVPQLLVTV